MRGASNLRPFIAPLARELRNQDVQRRDDVLQTLQMIASPETVRSILVSAVAGDDPEIRKWAAARIDRIRPAPSE
jgi:hypothetical protein